MVERRTVAPDVAGSIPVTHPTNQALRTVNAIPKSRFVRLIEH